jgi:5-methylcytosine-specific restriction endonuclease McrA
MLILADLASQVKRERAMNQMGWQKRWKIHQRDQWRCWYCGRNFAYTNLELYFWPPDRSMPVADLPTVDHLIPRHHGGSSTPDNLVTACWPCNGSKGRKTVEEYRAYLQHQGAAFQAYQWLLSALDEAVTSPPPSVKDTLGWLAQQIPAVIFWGEA